MPPFEFDIGTTTQTEVDDDGHLSSQVDHYGEEKAGVPALESHHPYGFMGRHMDPDVDAAGTPVLGAQTMHAWEGNTGHTWPQEDPRVQLKLPTLKPGESLWYGPAGQFGRQHLDGRTTLLTTHDGTPDGRAIFAQLQPVTANDPLSGGVTIVSPFFTIRAGQAGINMQTLGGASVSMGGFGAAGVPADSFVNITAARVSINAPTISLGTGSQAASEAALTILATFISAANEILQTVVTGPAPAKTAAAAAAAMLMTISVAPTPPVPLLILNVGKPA